MNKQQIEGVILRALETINEELPAPERFAAGPETLLFGHGGVLDSLSLVSLIVDVETAVMDSTGLQISLTDDRAMSQAEYPFGSVALLTIYIEQLLNEGLA
jgi:hypothetical protein